MKRFILIMLVAVLLVGIASAAHALSQLIVNATPNAPESQMSAKFLEGVKRFGSPASFYVSGDGENFFGIMKTDQIELVGEMHMEFSPDNRYLLIAIVPFSVHAHGVENENGRWSAHENYLYDILNMEISRDGNFLNAGLPGGYVVSTMGWNSTGHTLTVEYHELHGGKPLIKSYTAEKWFSTSAFHDTYPYMSWLLRPLQWAINDNDILSIKAMLNRFSVKDVAWFTGQIQKVGPAHLGKCNVEFGDKNQSLLFTCPGVNGSIGIYARPDKTGKMSLGTQGPGWNVGASCAEHLSAISNHVLAAVKKQDFKKLRALLPEFSKKDFTWFTKSVTQLASGNLSTCQVSSDEYSLSIICQEVPRVERGKTYYTAFEVAPLCRYKNNQLTLIEGAAECIECSE